MILEVKHVKKFFGDKKILDDVNFTLDAGECLAIVGLSGCGKSTLARIIAGLIPSDGGEIILPDGEFYRNVQMIFQSPEDSFNPRRTLGQSISEPIKNFNLSVTAEELLKEVGLPAEFSKRYPHEVSGGQCQRAAIARAIAVAPKILICDEATSALDTTTAARILELIKKLSVEKNIACLFITHDLFLIESWRVLELRNGKLQEVSHEFKTAYRELLGRTERGVEQNSSS